MTPMMYLVTGVALTLAAMYLFKRIASFRAQTPQDYAGKGPNLDIREHLNGPILCEGVIYGPTGRVASRFVADFEASWTGNTGRMTEHFRYDSGSEQHRAWTLTCNTDGSIGAEADDLQGTGTGQQAGPSVMLNYRIKLTEDAGGHVLDVTDWMYLMENGTIMNRSQFRKFGLKVGELVATMRPNPDKAALQDAA